MSKLIVCFLVTEFPEHRSTVKNVLSGGNNPEIVHYVLLLAQIYKYNINIIFNNVRRGGDIIINYLSRIEPRLYTEL